MRRLIIPLVVAVIALTLSSLTAADATVPSQSRVTLQQRVKQLETKVTKLQQRVTVLRNDVDALRVLLCLQIPSC